MVSSYCFGHLTRRLWGHAPLDPISSVFEQFKQLGVVNFEPCRRTTRWLERARRSADATYRSDECTYEYEGSWVQHHRLVLTLPPNQRFHRFLRQLFPGNRHLKCDTAHLSSLDPGYPRSDEKRRYSLGRHVDGAVSEGKVMWHGVIVGVLLSDVLEPMRGNPVSWPGSHFETRQAFQQLGPSPSEAELSQLIAAQCTAEISAKPEHLIARAGTIVVMDHALHHGMAPNEGDTIRHAAYYRLPWAGISSPEDILDPEHFFRRNRAA